MKLIHYLEQLKTKKKDLHVYHIEQLATTGDISSIKDIFNSILNKLIDDSIPIKITQKIDGVPILFGNTEVNGNFVTLKNKSFSKGKIDLTQVFFSEQEIKNSTINENNKGLLLNCFKYLIPKVKKNTIYFGELLFSNHSNTNISDKKNQGKIISNKDFIISQPNLLYYKISGVKESQEFGILEIGLKKNIKDLSEFKASDITDSDWNISSNKVFITDGKIEVKLSKTNKIISNLKKRIKQLPNQIEKNSKFRITDYFVSGSDSQVINEISSIKEEILDILKTKRTIIGIKGIETNEEIDEGVIVKTNDFIVKFVSKNFFAYARSNYSNLTGVERGKDLNTFKVLFVGKFQPFHKGHFKAFKELENNFKNVLMITSDSNKEGPLNFQDKKQLIVASGINENKIQKRPEGMNMYSFNMSRTFSDITKEIVVYAISEKDKNRFKEDSKNKVIEIKNENDFDMAKKLVSESLNSLREAKVNYTFITFPKSLKNDDEDLSSTKLRVLLKNGKSIKSFVPYDERKNKNVLDKFK